MEIEFQRTGERRYAVSVRRRGLPPVEMNPAPGYDPVMPHDLLHYIVESELGLRRGIFGQIAGGGDAGTFHAVAANGVDRREAARSRRRAARRGGKMLREGREDSAQSEQATYVCLQHWLARSAGRGGLQPKHLRELPPAGSVEGLTESRLDRICARMDELSARWASLKIGESFAVEWPDR